MKRSSNIWKPGADFTLTITSNAYCRNRAATRCSRPRKIDAAASSHSSAIQCKTSRTTILRKSKRSSSVSQARRLPANIEPMTVALVPLRNLGKVHASVSDLAGPGGTIPASAIDLGFVSYRLSRVTSEGTVYTIAPRLIMPGGDVEMPQGLTRRFWMTVRTPATARPGLYKGILAIQTDKEKLPAYRSSFASEPARFFRWTSPPVRSATRRRSLGLVMTSRLRRSISR